MIRIMRGDIVGPTPLSDDNANGLPRTFDAFLVVFRRSPLRMTYDLSKSITCVVTHRLRNQNIDAARN